MMEETNVTTGKKVLSGLFWKFGERFIAQGVSFLVSVALARLLTPDDYGIVAMVLIFITLADVFVSSGFSTALIQKKDADSVDFSTMFYCSFASSMVVYLVLFLIAPFAASFFQTPILAPVLRIFALRIPLSAYNSIQHAYVSKHMLFRRFFFSTLIGTIISGVVGIAMAYHGFGVWALIAQYFTNTIVDTIVLAVTVPWHLQWKFSWRSAKELMGYGWKILAASFSGVFFDQLRSFVVAKFYTSADLAYYNKGHQLPALFTTNLSNAVISVLFPAIARENDHLERVKAMARRALRLLSYVIVPLLIGLAAISDQLVPILFTDKWLLCIPYVKIFCISSALSIIGSTALQTITAIGRSDVILKLEFWKKPVYILLFFIGAFISVKAVAYTMLIYNVYGTLVNAWQMRTYIHYSVKEQLLDIRFPVLAGTAMWLVLLLFNRLQAGRMAIMAGKIAAGIFLYVFFSVITKNESFAYLKSLIGKGILKIRKSIRREKGKSV